MIKKILLFGMAVNVFLLSACVSPNSQQRAQLASTNKIHSFNNMQVYQNTSLGLTMKFPQEWYFIPRNKVEKRAQSPDVLYPQTLSVVECRPLALICAERSATAKQREMVIAISILPSINPFDLSKPRELEKLNDHLFGPLTWFNNDVISMVHEGKLIVKQRSFDHYVIRRALGWRVVREDIFITIYKGNAVMFGAVGYDETGRESIQMLQQMSFEDETDLFKQHMLA